MREQKKHKNRQKKLTRALYFCYILFLSLIIDVIMRGEKSPIFILPLSLCVLCFFPFLPVRQRAEVRILGQEALCVASEVLMGPAFSSGEEMRHQKSWCLMLAECCVSDITLMCIISLVSIQLLCQP